MNEFPKQHQRCGIAIAQGNALGRVAPRILDPRLIWSPERAAQVIPAAAWVASLVLLLLLPACTTAPGEHGSQPAYPLSIEQYDTLNIQVTRDVTEISFTNTTARTFGPSRLWLNGEYGRDLEPLEIGETITLDLRDFVNENGEPFRAGGFFAAEQPEVLVLAQLEVDNPRRLLGLIVVDGDAD